MSKTWICSSNTDHVFTKPTNDLFCDKCPAFSGVLMETDGALPAQSAENNESGGSNEPDIAKSDIGLYMFLVDASSSMFSENAFENVAMNRAKFVCAQISAAIFSLKDMGVKDKAYLFVLLFDHTLKPFINFMSVEQVFAKYSTAEDLEKALYNEMEALRGATDINLALKTAYIHAQKFIDGEMEVLGKIKPMAHAVFNPQTGDEKNIPNVRCLIFTDGQQYTGKGTNEIERNPFSDFTYDDEYVNILMGAYHGDGQDAGCVELKSIISNCHIHNEPQFFLFDTAETTSDMYKLFRMASGPSGFCSKCLANITISDE